MWEKIRYWFLWLIGKAVRVKLYDDEDELNFFVEKELFERFREAAHKVYGPGEDAVGMAIEEGIGLVLAFGEGPEEFEKYLNSKE